MDLDAVDEVGVERRVQHVADVRVVVPEAREALAGVHVEVRASVDVVEVGAARGRVLLVEAEDPQDVDERGVEVASGEVERLAGARERVGGDTEGVGGLGLFGTDAHGAWRLGSADARCVRARGRSLTGGGTRWSTVVSRVKTDRDQPAADARAGNLRSGAGRADHWTCPITSRS